MLTGCLTLASRPLTEGSERSAFYTALHKQIYKTKDKAADLAAFFPGLPAKSFSMKKVPSDPQPALSRKAKKVLLIVLLIVLVLGAGLAGIYVFRDHPLVREKLQPAVAAQ